MSLTRRSRSLRSSPHPHPPPRHRYRPRPHPQSRWRPLVLDALPRLPSVCCLGRLFLLALSVLLMCSAVAHVTLEYEQLGKIGFFGGIGCWWRGGDPHIEIRSTGRSPSLITSKPTLVAPRYGPRGSCPPFLDGRRTEGDNSSIPLCVALRRHRRSVDDPHASTTNYGQAGPCVCFSRGTEKVLLSSAFVRFLLRAVRGTVVRKGYALPPREVD